jgi:hypothetical protein
VDFSLGFIPFSWCKAAMKTLGAIVLSIVFAATAASAAGNVRTIANIRGIPTGTLSNHLPPSVWKKLAAEPVKAWIAVHGHVRDRKVVATGIAHSEANGVYDKAALQIATGMELYSASATESRIPSRVIVHVLVYDLPKGEHAIAMAQDDNASGANGWLYSHSIRMRFLGLKQ